jgi:serine/threonine protein kinase
MKQSSNNVVMYSKAETFQKSKSQSSTVISPYITPGDYLKEYKNDEKYNLENFTFLKLGEAFNTLGTGKLGIIYLVKNNLDEQLYALKKISKEKVSKAGLYDKLMAGLNVQRRIVHENVVKVFSFYEDSEFVYVVMEYLENCIALKTLIKMHSGLKEKKAFKYFIQAANVVMFLQGSQIVHKGIRSENILIDCEGKVKLCDFRYSIEINKTVNYDSVKSDNTIDVKSLGVLLYESLHNKKPNNKGSSIEFKDINEDCKDLINSNL